jgi:hypothetical protein
MKTSFQYRVSSFVSRAGQRLLGNSIAALAALGLPSDAAAQGCAMCYTSASAARSSGLEALRDGIFILLFPPLLMFGAILWHSFRRRGAREAFRAERVPAPLPVGFGPLER